MLVKEKTETQDIKIVEVCDVCGVPAQSMAKKKKNILCFCGHHARMHEPALFIQGFVLSKIDR